MKPATIHHLPYPVTILDPITGWHHNPSISTDPLTNTTHIAIRHHLHLPLIMHLEPDHPHSGEASRLLLSPFDTTTLRPTELRLMRPVADSPPWLLSHNIEDVRIFHRSDGLHGVGVGFPGGRITQLDVLLDYDTSSYRLVRDYGQPHGHTEKNWSPPATKTELFDFIYSPTQVVKHGIVRGTDNALTTHGGSQLLPYQGGYISIAHRLAIVPGVTERWYVSFAQLHDEYGFVTQTSQFFDFGSGWRENLQESVEFIVGAIWTIPDKELLLSLGVRDETCGFVRVPVSAFEWGSPNGWHRIFTLDSGLMSIVRPQYVVQ